MFKAKHVKSLIVAILLISTMLFTACDQLDLDLFGKKEELEIPTMAQDLDNVQLERDEKGLSKSDRQYLAYAKDKAEGLSKAAANFEKSIDTFLKEVYETAQYIYENKDYSEAKLKIMEVVRQVEAVQPDQIPEEFVEVYTRLYQISNRLRHMLFQVESKNATNLPEVFNEMTDEITPFQEELNKFFEDVNNEGLGVAAANIPATDWDAEESRTVSLRNSFNVSDFGLKWGSGRWDVMGVEGLRRAGFMAENLSYDCVVYQYNAVRSYHFNEYGQLDSYKYDIDADSFTPNDYPDNPVYDDVKELSAIVMYDYISDTYAMPQEPYNDGAGNLTVSFDPPAESVILQGNTESLIVVVEGKTVDEAAAAQ